MNHSAPLLFGPAYTLFSGAALAPNVPQAFPVSLGGHAYLVDLVQYQRETLDALRSATDTGEKPGEGSLSTVGVWRRSATHWELGAGQVHFDEADSNDFRFRTSKGIDPWTVRTMRLLPEVSSKMGSISSAALSGALLSIGNSWLYAAVDEKLSYIADPSVASPAWNPVTIGTAGTVTSMTTDGNKIYWANAGNGVWQTVIGSGSSSQLSTQNVTELGFSNGFLVAANGNVLYQINAAGTATALFTHFNPNFAFVTIAEAPTGIFIGGNSADKGEFYFVGFNASTGGLAVPIPAGALPRGEFINELLFYGGIMVLGTSKGFRLAELVQDRGLSYGPVITIAGNVRCLCVDGDFAWCGVSNFDPSTTGIGRAWLARFTEPLVPAYASDLMANMSGEVTSVASFAGRRYFFVVGNGIQGPTAGGVLVASGSISSGKIRYSTIERKILSTVGVWHEPLVAGKVTVDVSNDEGASVTLGTSDMVGTTQPTSEFSGASLKGEELEVNLTLSRGDVATNVGPVVKRWTMRAIIVPVRTDAIIVPIILKTKVLNLVGSGQEVRYDPLGEFEFLKSLEASRTPVTYQEGNLAQTVVVDKVAVKPEKWDIPIHNWFEATVFVRLLTVQSITGG